MTNDSPNNKSIGMSIAARINWLSSINWQVDFYQNSKRKKRVDAEYDWAWLERYNKKGCRKFVRLMLSKAYQRLHMRDPVTKFQEWLNKNSALLWESRELLSDELSKLLFDSMLILRCSGYNQFYFPRINFEDFVSLVNEEPFSSEELPLDYLGLPLRVFQLELHHQHKISTLRVVSTKFQINLLNSYRQYFIQRESVNMTPFAGDVVLDCGACIGEVSVIFAGFVGIHGEVHLFDPIPLHVQYCRLQATLNPFISHVFRFNVMAVGDISRKETGLRNDSSSISPSGLSVDSYSVTSLDDYVSNEGLSRVDVIKMDIEGAEMAALEGTSQVIREFKPRLAISAYHKPEDLWEIPHKLMTLNTDYRLFFGHHSPMQWESVYYAA